MRGPKGIGRREALKRVGTLAAAPLVAGHHPLVPVQEGAAWRPRLLDDDEAALVADLAEHIIPETDTPGARAANVHQYVDWMLSQAPHADQRAFRGGLARFDGADAADQRALLTEMQDTPFFAELKRLVVDGYYGSAVGMEQELGFRGRSFQTTFDGCTHEAHLGWEPER